ncbi:MAG TPA: signal peptidase II [Rhodospirillaceae bacterium]|nr:signal peptidase II [Rhodospirillaceae bacterium]
MAAWALRRRGLGIALLAAVLDQVSKLMILAHFRPPDLLETPFASGERVVVLPILDFVLSWNSGVSFGFGNTHGPYNALIFTALALVISGFLVQWMGRAERWTALLAMGLVVGGAAGNVLDRLRFGAVVDFLYVHIGAFDWWPAFNLADSAICIGAGLLMFDSLFADPLSHKNMP